MFFFERRSGNERRVGRERRTNPRLDLNHRRRRRGERRCEAHELRHDIGTELQEIAEAKAAMYSEDRDHNKPKGPLH